ncbi:MAG: CoA transferase [Acidimicrobiia bacterium]|nr:CoA transferase [Acidimicrobiia bacterium]
MDDDRVLAGVRVFELSIAVAAPSCGRALAYHGAEVIKVESRQVPDVARLFGSAWARDAEHAAAFYDTGPYVPEMSAGKRSVGLELKEPGAIEAAYALAAQCDVFLTNYALPAVRGLGLDYPDLKAVRDDIIYVAMPGFGANPELPYYPFRAFGPNQAPLVGLDVLTGLPGEEPAGIATIAPPDYVAGLHAVMGVLSALEHRDRTGEGCRIDISQFETTVALLGPYLADNAITGAVPEPAGNRVGWAAPTGTYRCSGADRWVAISVDDDTAWAALVALTGDPALADPRFATLAGRRDHHGEIDGLIEGWTAAISPDEAAARLQAAGVAAYPVNDHRGVLWDPQVRDRGWFDTAPCSRFERDLFSGHPIRLTDTPARVDRAGPSMGEDTVAVLRDIAGLDQSAVDDLVARGAAFTENEPERKLRRPFDAWFEIAGLVDEGAAR